MSRTSILLLIIIVVGLGSGIAWRLLRFRPGELDIAAKEPPELPPIKVGPTIGPGGAGRLRTTTRPTPAL